MKVDNLALNFVQRPIPTKEVGGKVRIIVLGKIRRSTMISVLRLILCKIVM